MDSSQSNGRTWLSNTDSQVLTINNPIPWYTGDKQTFDAYWNIRDNDNLQWNQQIPVWFKDLDQATDLPLGALFEGTYSGYEVGGPYYLSLKNNNTDSLTTATSWVPLITDPTVLPLDIWISGVFYDYGTLLYPGFVCINPDGTLNPLTSETDWQSVGTLTTSATGVIDLSVPVPQWWYGREERLLYTGHSARSITVDTFRSNGWNLRSTQQYDSLSNYYPSGFFTGNNPDFPLGSPDNITALIFMTPVPIRIKQMVVWCDSVDTYSFVTNVEVADSGAGGYIVGDVLVAVFPTDGSVQVTVTSVDESGNITGFTYIDGNQLTSTIPPNPIDTTGGTGSGAELDLTWISVDTYSFVTNVEVADSGAGGYIVGDVLVAVFPTDDSVQVTVTSVDGSGNITGFTYTGGNGDEQFTSTIPTNPIATTGGTGSGADLDLTWTIDTTSQNPVCRLAIYEAESTTSTYPKSLIFQSPELSVSAGYIPSSPPDLVLKPGRAYWFCFLGDRIQACTFGGTDDVFLVPVFGIDTSSFEQYYGIQLGFTYGPFPTLFPSEPPGQGLASGVFIVPLIQLDKLGNINE